MGRIAVGPLPHAGQTVRFTVARRPVRMELTCEPLASAIDADEGRAPAVARWLTLTGWEVDENGRRLFEYTVTVPRAGTVIVVSGSGAAGRK